MSSAVGGAPGRPSSWLSGPASDLLLGCGLAYMVVVALMMATGSVLPSAIPGGILILLFTVPHYGATLLRVYEQAEDRHKYRLFAVHITLALVLSFVLGLQVGLLGSLAVTVYLTWSPWHYTGQNYGIALMLLGRRGVVVTAGVKRLIWGSFVSSYLLTFLAIHGAERSANYAPISPEGTVFQLIPLGIPFDWAFALVSICAAVYAVSTVAAIVGLARSTSRLADLGPAVLLMATQSLWFSVPVLLRISGWLGAGSFSHVFSSYGFLWIAAAHSVQYLWITSYYATRSDASQSRLRFLGKAALAGYAVWTVPGLIFAPGLLGSVAYDSGLALLVASFVNLHHFVLDGAVWKLRDGRVGSVLLRSDAPAAPRVAASGRGWIRKAAWTAGVVSIGVSLVGFWESEFGFRRALARGDIERVDTALGRFAAIGRDGPAKWTRVGRYLVDQKDFARASLHLEHSIELAPTHRALHTLGLMRAQQRLWEPAVAAFDRAIELVPDSEQALYGRGLVFLEMGRPADATVDLERVIELHPRHDKARFALGRARAVLRATAKQSSAR